MAVHNGLPYLEASVRSILAQELADFEFVIGDDGSSDGSSPLLATLASQDSRIRVIRREQRSGLAHSANWVVREAGAPLVAVCHADDLSSPDRFAGQLAVLERHHDVQLVGTLSNGINSQGTRISDHWMNAWRLDLPSVFAPFAHSSIMFRKAAFDQVGGYRPEAEYWEDLDLYFRIAQLGRIAVIPRPLVDIRFSENSSRLRDDAAKVDRSVDLMFRSVRDLEAGGEYPARFPEPAARLLPQTFVGRASVRLWDGRSPKLFGRMLRTADLRFDLASLKAIVFVGWASTSPRTLRFVLRVLGRFLGWLRAADLDRDVVDWRPLSHDDAASRT